jgi:hypothetical protein
MRAICVVLFLALAFLSLLIPFEGEGKTAEVPLRKASENWVYPDSKEIENLGGSSTKCYCAKYVTSQDFLKVSNWYYEKLFGGPRYKKVLEQSRFVFGDLDVFLDNSKQVGGDDRPVLINIFHTRRLQEFYDVHILISQSTGERYTYITLSLLLL